MATPTRQLEGPLPALAGGAVPELSAHAEPGGDGEQQRGVEAQRHAHAARVRQRARRRRPRQHPHVAARALRRQRLCSTNTDGGKVHVNTVQKQFKDTECGMFCLYFLIEALKKKNLHDIYANSIRDEDVHALRKLLFMN